LAIEDEKVQEDLLDLIIKNDWSVRKTEQFVIGYKQGGKKPQQGKAKTRIETSQTKKLSKFLRAPVQVKTTAKGGQLIISYESDEDLDRIYRLFM
jgi:ParB-like chromosome segregation protein Spo0J